MVSLMKKKEKLKTKVIYQDYLEFKNSFLFIKNMLTVTEELKLPIKNVKNKFT